MIVFYNTRCRNKIFADLELNFKQDWRFNKTEKWRKIDYGGKTKGKRHEIATKETFVFIKTWQKWKVCGTISKQELGLYNLGFLSLSIGPIKRVILGKSSECLRTDQSESFFFANVLPLLNVLFNDFVLFYEAEKGKWWKILLMFELKGFGFWWEAAVKNPRICRWFQVDLIIRRHLILTTFRFIHFFYGSHAYWVSRDDLTSDIQLGHFLDHEKEKKSFLSK